MDDDLWICTDLVNASHLRRRTSLQALLVQRLKGIPNRKPGRAQRLAVKQEIEKLANLAVEGDEWWEWMDGADEPEGMQLGGLALVRDGKVIWAKQTWLN